ncbi:neurogenic differentiation factor 1 [Elysia marginata]|uniref:Neurogenic differentiation factor 1 n=1 Tax=Elysia marginata TaxID=1093978 RepID=A0AAV4ED89_9GAST|nr:neurogenic differentiation factor 1 [Elysia marginata]
MYRSWSSCVYDEQLDIPKILKGEERRYHSHSSNISKLEESKTMTSEGEMQSFRNSEKGACSLSNSVQIPAFTTRLTSYAGKNSASCFHTKSLENPCDEIQKHVFNDVKFERLNTQTTNCAQQKSYFPIFNVCCSKAHSSCKFDPVNIDSTIPLCDNAERISNTSDWLKLFADCVQSEQFQAAPYLPFSSSCHDIHALKSEAKKCVRNRVLVNDHLLKYQEPRKSNILETNDWESKIVSSSGYGNECATVHSSHVIADPVCDTPFQSTQHSCSESFRNMCGNSSVTSLIQSSLFYNKTRETPLFSSLDNTNFGSSHFDIVSSTRYSENHSTFTFRDNIKLKHPTDPLTSGSLNSSQLSRILQPPTSSPSLNTYMYQHGKLHTETSTTVCPTKPPKPDTGHTFLSNCPEKDSICTEYSRQPAQSGGRMSVDSAATTAVVKQNKSSLLAYNTTVRPKRTRRHVPHAMRSPGAVDKRNSRERRRIGGVNHAFEVLRKHTPSLSHLERASKIRILRQAQAYIRELSTALAYGNQQT